MTHLTRIGAMSAAAIMFMCVAAGPLPAQTPTSVARRSASALFSDAAAKENAVRKVLASDNILPTLLKAVRTVVSDYETVVRHFPTSGYCDDALWRAAVLSRDAFEAFQDVRERQTALRLLQHLAREYPSSKYVSQTSAQLSFWASAPPGVAAVSTAVAAARAPVVVGDSGAVVKESASRAESSPAATSKVAVPIRTVKEIRRTVLPDVVRVVIELDGEVTFKDQRLEAPTRVFVDMPGTRADSTLTDNTMRFDADPDIVRMIRVGRHPNNTTRVVLEGAGIATYSVYPLYSPFRLIIDCLRTPPAGARSGLTPANVPREPVAAGVPASITKPSTSAGVFNSLAAPASGAAPASAVAAPTLPESERPAWATTLKKSEAVAVAPPALRTRKFFRWRMELPSVRVTPLPPVAAMPEPAAAAGATAVAATAPTDSIPDPATVSPLPASSPSAAHPAPTPPASNVAGGLSIARQLGLGVSRIVIDPGHGGHDPGAKASGVTESELVLDVALRLEKLLQKVPGVEVVLTRRDDTFVSLQERTAIANRQGADLFLSIHANASKTASTRGVETYFLNFASNRTAAAVAARENAASGQTMAELQDVVKSIALSNKRDESRDFATYVQREMMASLRVNNQTLKDLGVKQAPFVVLIGASMPSVLAEISFLTNPQDARLLKNATYRQRIAQALFEGVRRYQSSLKSMATVAQQQN